MKGATIVMAGLIIGVASLSYMIGSSLTGSVVPCFEGGMANGTFLPGPCAISMSAPVALLTSVGLVIYGNKRDDPCGIEEAKE